MPTEIICPYCKETTTFAQAEGSDVACSICGTVDTALTSTANLRDTFRGYDVADNFSNSASFGYSLDQEARMQAAAERRFQERMTSTAISWLFYRPNILGLSTQNNPLGEAEAENPFIRSVMRIFGQIRHRDKLEQDAAGKFGRRKDTTNADGRRVTNQLALAIRFAAMQNNLLLAYQILGKEGAETFPAVYVELRPVVPVVLPVPFITNMIDNMKPNHPDGENPIGESKYLNRQYKRFVRLLQRPCDPLFSILSNCHLVIQRLQAIVAANDDAALQPLLYNDQKSSRLYRKWKPEDFDYFREEIPARGGWDKVLRIAYHLYRAQQCCMIWGNSTSYTYAVGLALTAAFGVVGSTYPYTSYLLAELCARYGTSHFQAGAAMNSLRRQIIAWTSSFTDCGLEIPHLNLPSKGLVGEGTSGWNGDARRGVPPSEIWVVAIEPVAMNWRKIRSVRMLNKEVIQYRYSLVAVKTMMAQVTVDARKRNRAKTGFSVHALILKQQEAELRSTGTAPSPRSRTITPSGSEGGWEIDDDPEVWFNRGPDLSDVAPDPTWHPLVLQVQDSATSMDIHLPGSYHEKYIALENRTPADDLQALLEEDSSDEEDAHSSDDEFQPRDNLGLKGAQSRKRRTPNAGLLDGGFSIGPDGHFAREEVEKEEEMGNNPVYERHSPASRRSALSDYDPEEEPELLRERSASIPPMDSRSERLASPASSLHSISSTIHHSVPPSRCSSVSFDFFPGFPVPLVLGKQKRWVPKPSRPITELSPARIHIASLIRERDQYRPYAASADRAAGRMVSREIEEYMTGWLNNLKAKRHIELPARSRYLASIGLQGKNPMKDDLSIWIRRMEHQWSPLECVLRAGISPREIPQWMVPHSKIAVKRLLEHKDDLPSLPVTASFPSIPDRFTADPIKYAREIKKLRDDWEEYASDTVIFFMKHEKFPVLASADALFEEGEFSMYIAEDSEVEQRKKDKDFMTLIEDRDENGVAMTELEVAARRRKAELRAEKEDLDKVSYEFKGYERAINDEDYWAEAALLGRLQKNQSLDEEGNVVVDENNFWGDQDDEATAAVEAADEAWGNEMAVNGKRKAVDASAPPAPPKKRKKKETTQPPDESSRATSVSSNQTIRPEFVAPLPVNMAYNGAHYQQPFAPNTPIPGLPNTPHGGYWPAFAAPYPYTYPNAFYGPMQPTFAPPPPSFAPLAEAQRPMPAQTAPIAAPAAPREADMPSSATTPSQPAQAVNQAGGSTYAPPQPVPTFYGPGRSGFLPPPHMYFAPSQPGSSGPLPSAAYSNNYYYQPVYAPNQPVAHSYHANAYAPSPYHYMQPPGWPPTPSRRPLDIASLLNPIGMTPTPSPPPFDFSDTSMCARVPEASRANPSPPPSRPVKVTPAKAKPTASTAKKASTNKPKSQAKIRNEGVEVRRLVVNVREFKTLQILYLKTQMKEIYIKAGASEVAASRGGEGIPLDAESVKRMISLRTECNVLEDEVEKTRKETVNLQPDRDWVKKQVKEWAAERAIPLRMLGWGQQGTVLE